jgi:hypothetical protein
MDQERAWKGVKIDLKSHVARADDVKWDKSHVARDLGRITVWLLMPCARCDPRTCMRMSAVTPLRVVFPRVKIGFDLVLRSKLDLISSSSQNWI